VAAVRAPNPARDPADEAGSRPAQPRRIDRVPHEQLAAHAPPVASRQLDNSNRADRALASYAQVAADGERSSLHDLLGFDAYA